jgi:mono/diheme cytochrome c family protein
MKHLLNSTLVIILFSLALSGCKSKGEPGRIYMPDMAYSRAYETYALRDSSKFTTDASKRGSSMIFYNNMPPAGTVKRGEMFAYTLLNDSNGYKMSAAVKNPIADMSALELPEAQRLYNINCGICHGDKGAGNGPLAAKIGAVANLTLPMYVSMADGTMFHSITYGKNNMGSYASQLDRRQRWMMVNYIRTLQPKAESKSAADSAVIAKPAADTAAKKSI